MLSENIKNVRKNKDYYGGRYYEAIFTIADKIYLVDVRGSDDPVALGELFINSMDIDTSLKDEYSKAY